MTSPAFRAFASLALIVVAALPGSAQKLSPPTKKSPPPAAPQARPATPPSTTTGAPRAKPLAPGLRGEASSADENEGREADPPFDPRALMSKGKSAPAHAASAALHLANHPKRDELAKWLVDNLRGREIDVALLGGEKYMINSCFGIKVSSGTFKLKLENPSVRFENSGIVVSFGIDRVGFSAIKLRMKPNPNILETCSFSRKFEVGGSMEDVRLTLRLDPLYDPERCRLGAVTDLNPEVRIGNLNLKPLQNDLDRMAKNMVEDSLTFALQVTSDGMLSALGDLLLSAMDQFLEADCPTQPGDTGRAIADVTRGLGLGGGGKGKGSSSGSGGAAPAATTPTSATPAGGGSTPAAPASQGSDPAVAAQVAALVARIEELEARIAQLEAEPTGVVLASTAGTLTDTDALAQLLQQILAQGGAPERSDSAGKVFAELLGQLLAASAESPDGLDLANWLAVRISGAAPISDAAPTAAAAPWYVVPNPALTGRMGRIVVTFPDKQLLEKTHVAVLRDGKKVTDRYGEGTWELLPGVHDVAVTSAKVVGCDVRAGHDTVVRVGLLQIELGEQTHFAVFPKGGTAKLFDTYGSAAIGLPVGEYEVEIQGQRVAVALRDGEVTRF
ncbi:MAG TPA: ABC transporter C-terminal domain-containing protein [Planctomycetota bacterium]|nr:ABC transporter C-terminal domain-containing protein [Planctomycetota bacterium]